MHQARSIRLGLLVTLALALVPTIAVAQDEDAVRDETLQWQERYNAGDAAGIADLYTEDLRWTVLSGTTHTDREGVLAQVNGLFEAGYDAIQIEVDDVLVRGDMATSMGTWTLTGADVPDFTGQYMSALVREDGVWRTARHVNYVFPPPPPADP